jgi:hAT family C-terminal dimerisation region
MSQDFALLESYVLSPTRGDTSTMSGEGHVEARYVDDQIEQNGLPAEVDAEDGDVDEGTNEATGDDDDEGDAEGDREEGDDEDGEQDDEPRLTQEEMRALIVKAKDCITLQPHTAQRKRADASPTWLYFFGFTLKDGCSPQDVAAYDAAAAREIEAKISNTNHKLAFFCCNLCFRNGDKTLADCIRWCRVNNGPGNLTKHISSLHPKEFESFPGRNSEKAKTAKEIKKRKSSPFTSPVLAPPKPRIPPRSGSSSYASESNRKLAASSPHGNSTPDHYFQKVSVDSSLTSISYLPPSELPFDNIIVLEPQNVQLGTNELKKQFKHLQHRFANNNNLATRVTTDKTGCPEFHDLIQFCFNHGSQLKNERDVVMGKHAFNNHKKNEFNTLLGAATQYLDEARAFWKEYLGEQTKFIVIGHDVWDSKKKDCLGYTLFFYSPDRQQYFRIPLGLGKVEDKRSDGTSSQILDLLSMVGVTARDLYRAVNDTTNTALKVGRNLTGFNGTCAMHEIQLALEHATGRKTRRENKIVTDQYVIMEELRKKSLATSDYIMNLKSKGRFDKYKNFVKRSGRVANRIPQPNSTRAAGIILHFEGMIKERWNHLLYTQSESDPQAKELSNEEWFAIAQVLAVLYPIGRLIFNVQTDTPGNIAYTFYLIYRTFFTYCMVEEWDVAETRKEVLTEPKDRWNGNAKWPTRDKDGRQLGDSKDPFTEITLTTVHSDSLLPVARDLIPRLAGELKRYGVKAGSRDRLLASACNPFTAAILFPEMDDLSGMMAAENRCEAIMEELELNYKNKAIETLVEEIKAVCHKIIPAEEGADDPNDSNAATPTKGGVGAMVAERRKRRRLQQMREGVDTTEKDYVKKQVLTFFQQSHGEFDPRPHMPEKYRHVVGAKLDDWVENIELVAKHFDVFGWWQQVGKDLFPLIYPVAMRALSLPDSNGHQERTFSAATWMDGKLRSRQSDMTFQMKVILYKNQEFVRNDKKILAMTRTRELLQQRATLSTPGRAQNKSADGSDEEDDIDQNMDDDSDDFMGLYDAYGAHGA